MRILSNSVLPAASLSATTTGADSLVTNLANGNLFDFWSPSTVAEQTITVTFDQPSTVDAIGIAGHNLFESGVLSVTVKLFDAGALELSSDVITVESDKVILAAISSNLASSAEITFTTIEQMPFISSIYLGQSIYTSRSPEFGAELPFINNQASSKSVKSELGIVLGRLVIVPAGIKQNLTIKNLDLSWVLADWLPFVDDSLDVLFFITLSESIGVAVYALADSKKNPQYPAPDLANIRMAYSGVLE